MIRIFAQSGNPRGAAACAGAGKRYEGNMRNLWKHSLALAAGACLGAAGFYGYGRAMETVSPRFPDLEPRAKFETAAALPNTASGAPDFPLTEEGKKLAANARAFHKTPGVVAQERRGEAVCAGYVWGLAEILWGKAAPFYVGMMARPAMSPADAWELPASYLWHGGTVAEDFSAELRKWRADYLAHVPAARLETFFRAAFSPEAYLGDMGFLYRETGVTKFLGKYFNSHVGKNFGVSEWRLPVPENAGAAGAVSAAMGCRADFFEKLSPLLERYALTLDGKPAEWRAGKLYAETPRGWAPADPLPFSTLGVRDVAVAHFFRGEARVDGLFQMACRGEMLPALVMWPNPRLAGRE